MGVDLNSLPTNKRKCVPDTYFALRVLKEDAVGDVNKKLKTLAEANGINIEETQVFNKSVVVAAVNASENQVEISPVCAVMGGIVGQEVLKAISHKDKPIQNFFFLNGKTIVSIQN